MKTIFPKMLLALGFILTALLPCQAQAIHEISINETIEITSTVVLTSDDPIDVWDLSLVLPSGSTVLSVTDEVGEVDYHQQGDQVKLKTNPKKAKVREVVLNYKIDPWKQVQGLDFVELGLFGFENKTTFVRVCPTSPYLFSPNSIVEYGTNCTEIESLGSVSLRMVFGGEKESEHYFTNSDLDLETAEEFFPLIEGVTGIKSPVKFGIAILPESEYQEEYLDWSAGTFNGMILIKESNDLNETIATITHEATHGVNAFALDWDRTNISWFDEGVASYVGSAVYRMLGEQKSELFGSEKKWREGEYIYTLAPKKTPTDLWQYYYSGRDDMYFWYPQSDFDREFGYAYSELFIRSYVYENGSRLHGVFQELLKINDTVSDPEERNKIMVSILGEDFEPCYSKDLSEVRLCTKQLNEMNFTIPAGEGMELKYLVEEPALPVSNEEYAINYIREILRKIQEAIERILK